MNKFISFLLLTIFCTSYPLLAQAQDMPSRVHSDIFVGLDFIDAMGDNTVPRVQFGAHADYMLAGPLFVGADAAIYQERDAAWTLEPKVAVESGLKLHRDLMVFGVVSDVLGQAMNRGYGAGIKFKNVDVRSINHNSKWGLLVRFSVFRF